MTDPTSARWDQVQDNVLEHWEDVVRNSPTGLLYHYTNFDALQGIIKTHTLRATYSRVLNDGSERRYGEEVISSALKAYCSAGQHSDCSDDIDSAVKGISRPTFVMSFCDSGELLSMWRAYAHGGGGYCLGFDYSELDHLLLKDSPVSNAKSRLLKVSYGENLPLSIATLLKDIAALLKIHFDNASPLLEFVPMLADMIKHESFREEKEWRLIVPDPRIETMQFRAGHSNIKPYVDLSWRDKDGATEKLPLKEVICGPTLRPEDTPDEIMRWMLQANGYKHVDVRPSNIPYRL